MLVNEYTDWTRSVSHPLGLMDSLAELLGDALTVAPAIDVADSHAVAAQLAQYSVDQAKIFKNVDKFPKTFLYVFSHQVCTIRCFTLKIDFRNINLEFGQNFSLVLQVYFYSII